MIKASEKQTGKDSYWNSELRSLGINPKKKIVLNDKKELESLLDNVKQSLYQDYKIAYGIDGDQHKEEAESTINV